MPRGNFTRTLKPLTALQMSPCAAAWVGALVEGEGYVKSAKFFTAYLVVSSTEIETIATLFRLTGCGRVTMGTPVPLRKQRWIWKVSSARDLVSVLTQIMPYLCGDVRLEQAQRALAHLRTDTLDKGAAFRFSRLPADIQQAIVRRG